MAEETKQQEEKPEVEAAPEGAKPEPKAGPDWERAANEYRAQRDAARQQVADLQKQADDLKASMEGLKGADDVQKAVDDALSKASADFEQSRAQWAEREKALTVSNELAEKGCIDCAVLDPVGGSAPFHDIISKWTGPVIGLCRMAALRQPMARRSSCAPDRVVQAEEGGVTWDSWRSARGWRSGTRTSSPCRGR